MKKQLIAVMLVISMLTMFVGTVAAAPVASGRATLVGVEYVPGKGPVFTFAVSGEFTSADLKGSLHVEGGDDFDLYCARVEASTVTCTVSKKAAGKNVILSWGGSTFWASVPTAPEYCYHVYDYDLSNAWKDYGTNCQGRPAHYGDVIPWYNPDWGDTLDHYFLPDLSCAGISEDAYYFPDCPI
jgi:hypothetical protein